MKVAVTGGPGVGKTTLVHILECSFSRDVVIGVNAMDAIQLLALPPAFSDSAKKCRERAIYHLRVEMEKMAEESFQRQLIVCDQGGLDSLFYWPESSESFFQDVHSSPEQELARYDWVLQIEGPSNASLGLTVQEPLVNPRSFWAAHPKLISINAGLSFSACYSQVSKAVKGILAGKTLQEIKSLISSPTQSGFANELPL